MKTSPLASTQVKVTSLGFGAASIANLYTAVDDDTARAAIEAAWDGGVRYFDTAPHYGLGLSERRLGAALAEHPREEFTISTKVGRLLVPNPAPTGSDLHAGGFAVPDDLTREHDYSRDGVRRSLDASLERLGLGYADIVYIHDPEAHMDVAVGEAMRALVELREQGVVRAIGVGMNFTDPLQRFVTETPIDAVMIAGRWTLIDRSAQNLLDTCLERGVSVVAAAPFNSGLLARPWPTDDSYFDYEPAPPVLINRARELASACQRSGTTLPHAALRFPLRHQAVASVVVGLRTPEQSRSACTWAATPITQDAWRELDLGANPGASGNAGVLA
jgi:D-threo-aldose 1-dehydrogenase